MAPLRRGEDGYEFGPTWEDIVEKKIRQAMDAGLFDNLPGMGRPLKLEDNPYAGDWQIAFHVMRNAGVVPLWIEAGQEVQRLEQECTILLQRAERLAGPAKARLRDRLREEYQERLLELNAAIERFNWLVPVPWLQKVPLSVEAEMRKFDERWSRSSGRR